MKIYRFFSVIYLFTFAFFVSSSAKAGFITGEIVPCKTDCTLCHLWQLASNIINFLSFNLAIPVAALLFIAAGVIFLTSGGNESRITLGKSIFINTAIGLLIIFCSWLLIDTLIKTIVDPNQTIHWAWNKFPTCQ